MKQKVYFKTFGCRTNMFDTQIMMNNLKDFDVTLNEKEANIVIVNSCTVTNSADSTARNYINSLKKLPLNPRVVFTGCGVWTKGKSLFKEQKINSLFGSGKKEKINTLLKNNNRFFEIGDLKHIDNTIIKKMIGKSRAFVKIQEGCDFSCSYCIIPTVRGSARSYDEKHILKQIELLTSNGFSEFILTGTNIGSYSNKNSSKNTLAKLLKKISLINKVKRIRLGSIEPFQITDEFKEILTETWMAKHLHIALQHTSPTMLKLMNRRNNVQKDLALFEFLASKGYALGTDFIVGHPQESDNIWNEAMQNIQKFPLTHIHQFTYSKKENTLSATMKGQVNGNISKKRALQLVEIIKEKNILFRKQKQPLTVLIESKKDNIYKGYDQFFNLVEIKSDIDLIGNWVNIKNYQIKKDKNIAF